MSIVVHRASSYLTISWPIMCVERGCGDVGGSVVGWVVGGACREGVNPDGRDDGNDALDSSSRRLGEFNEDDFVVDQFWVRRRV